MLWYAVYILSTLFTYTPLFVPGLTLICLVQTTPSSTEPSVTPKQTESKKNAQAFGSTESKVSTKPTPSTSTKSSVIINIMEDEQQQQLLETINKLKAARAYTATKHLEYEQYSRNLLEPKSLAKESKGRTPKQLKDRLKHLRRQSDEASNVRDAKSRETTAEMLLINRLHSIATSNDMVEVLLDINKLHAGKAKLCEFATTATTKPSSTRQIYDTNDSYELAENFTELSKKKRATTKKKYIELLEKILLELAEGIADTMLPNSTIGDALKQSFGVKVEAATQARALALTNRIKYRKSKDFLFGHTRTEWDRMVLDRNDGQIVDFYDSSGELTRKKMKYNENKTALEYEDYKPKIKYVKLD